MPFKSFLYVFALMLSYGLSTSFFAVSTRAMAAVPNIVWIIADDMSPDVGAYGVSEVSTPHLDKLAHEGRLYRRAYASAPVCSSSRSAFILGCYQTTTGLHPHDVENPQPLPAPYDHLPGLLKRAGWFVTNASAPGSQRNGKAPQKAKTHYNFAHDSKTMFDGDDWRKRRPGQPFFAQFQITEPHRPFPIPTVFDEAKLRAIRLPQNYPDHPLVRRDWYAYQRSVEVVDQRVGAIVDQLEREGVFHDTLIMFFADHGRPMPWGKQWLSVEGLQVPLIIRGPGISSNSHENRLVSLIDLAPSILKLANLAIPDWMEGKPILQGSFPEREALFAARDRCGDAMDRIRAVVTDDSWLVYHFSPQHSRLNWSSYKEASYPGMPLLRTLHAAGTLSELQDRWLSPARQEIEFYDLNSDPQGIHDVASQPNRQRKLEGMRQQLMNWIQNSGDQGAGGDPDTEPSLATIQNDKRSDYQRTWLKRLQKPDPTDMERLHWWLQAYGLPAGRAEASH